VSKQKLKNIARKSRLKATLTYLHAPALIEHTQKTTPKAITKTKATTNKSKSNKATQKPVTQPETSTQEFLKRFAEGKPHQSPSLHQ
ncbi:Hypothetical predicted protein, partial [Drosophila guanche]